MLEHHILCIGRRAKDPLLDACDVYLERITHYAKIHLDRLRESDSAQEGKLLLAKIQPTDFVVALDEKGKSVATGALAKQFESWRLESKKLVWVIGGADGLSQDLKQRANLTLRLSDLTLPHRLAQVVLVEQIYRAHTILRGEKYHRI